MALSRDTALIPLRFFFFSFFLFEKKKIFVSCSPRGSGPVRSVAPATSAIFPNHGRREGVVFQMYIPHYSVNYECKREISQESGPESTLWYETKTRQRRRQWLVAILYFRELAGISGKNIINGLGIPLR